MILRALRDLRGLLFVLQHFTIVCSRSDVLVARGVWLRNLALMKNMPDERGLCRPVGPWDMGGFYRGLTATATNVLAR